MKMKKQISRSSLSLVLALVLAMGGCTSKGETVPPMEVSQDMPPTLEEGVAREGSFEAKLYFLSEDELRLVPETRQITYTGNISRAQAVIEALTQGPSSDVLRPCLSGNYTLERVELSSDACNVYLLSSSLPTFAEWLAARAAVAATIYDAEGIGSVNLYLNGVEPGYGGRPLGALAPISEQLGTYIANMEQEFRALAQQTGTEAGSYENRTVTLYFTDLEGELLIARNSTVNYDSSETRADVAGLLVSKLLDGDASLEPVVPADLTFAEQPQSIFSEDFLAQLQPQAQEQDAEEGDVPHPVDPFYEQTREKYEKQIIALRFKEPTYAYDEKILAGALTMTITGYLPNTEGVAIYMQQSDGTYRNLDPEGLYFTREDFSDMVGVNVYLPYPDAEGSVLHRVSRAVSSLRAYDPEVRLAELFKGPADPGVMYPLFTQEDVESVYVTGDLAVVNWRAGFTEKLQALLEYEDFEVPVERREQLFIYSVVNALTEIQGIYRVWMLEDGNKLGTVGEMYLGNALLRNPGIMIDE